MRIDVFQKQFAAGATPKALDGFYRGELLAVVPGTIVEAIGRMFLRIWLPWRGKWFDVRKKCGDNIVPPLAARLILLGYGSAIVGKAGFGGFHVLPFRTSTERGLADRIDVLRLDYDLPENPNLARTVIDELVALDDGTFLGKAYLRQGKEYRLVAFFRLNQPHHCGNGETGGPEIEPGTQTVISFITSSCRAQRKRGRKRASPAEKTAVGHEYRLSGETPRSNESVVPFLIFSSCKKT